MHDTSGEPSVATQLVSSSINHHIHIKDTMNTITYKHKVNHAHSLAKLCSGVSHSMLTSIVITDSSGSSSWHDSTATTQLNAMGKIKIWRTRKDPLSSVIRKNVCHHSVVYDGPTRACGQIILYAMLHRMEPAATPHGSISTNIARYRENGILSVANRHAAAFETVLTSDTVSETLKKTSCCQGQLRRREPITTKPWAYDIVTCERTTQGREVVSLIIKLTLRLTHATYFERVDETLHFVSARLEHLLRQIHI